MMAKKKRHDIRLACYECDTDSGDFVTEVEATLRGWIDIMPTGTLPGLLDWWDHYGWCPECIADGTMEESLNQSVRVKSAPDAKGQGNLFRKSD